MSEANNKITSFDAAGRLATAVRSAKITAADRGDVVIDMKEADRARLEILAQDLQPVFDDVPVDDQQWDFALTSGLQPRLWIDATSHVMMGRDRRTYRFVRDTRLGRTVLAESTDFKPISDAVTTYIAERIVERQQMLDGERTSLRAAPLAAPVVARPAGEPSRTIALSTNTGWGEFLASLTWFFIGAVAGAALLIALFWERLNQAI